MARAVGRAVGEGQLLEARRHGGGGGAPGALQLGKAQPQRRELPGQAAWPHLQTTRICSGACVVGKSPTASATWKVTLLVLHTVGRAPTACKSAFRVTVDARARVGQRGGRTGRRHRVVSAHLSASVRSRAKRSSAPGMLPARSPSSTPSSSRCSSRSPCVDASLRGRAPARQGMPPWSSRCTPPPQRTLDPVLEPPRATPTQAPAHALTRRARRRRPRRARRGRPAGAPTAAP